MCKTTLKQNLAWGGLLCLLTSGVHAHSGDVIASPGITGAIDVTVVDAAATEFTAAGATTFSIDSGHPNSADVWALHRSDGIYVRAEITDATPNNSDSLFIYFDLEHNDGGALDGDDWGVEISRDGTPTTWGPATDASSSWSPIPAGNVGVSAFGGNPWIVEFNLVTGALDATHELDFSTDGGRIGVYFQIFSALEEFGEPASLTYNQWPDAVDDLPFEDDPSRYGNYEFDPSSTFPDITLEDLRNGYDGAENYRKISKSATNEFEVRVSNPGGTALGDANDVRINLYLAARGIGESWHRVDQETVLNNDCQDFSSSDWPALDFTGVTKDEVCDGNSPHPDVGTMDPNDIINNTAEYTVHESVNRAGGENVTIGGGTDEWYDILTWNTTAAQDVIYSTHGTTRLDHQCMKAEAIYADDPNKSDNVRQSNMDFVCLPEFFSRAFDFVIGWAEFTKYDPDRGAAMYLNVSRVNMDDEGWGFALEGAKQVGEHSFVVELQGERSRQLQAIIRAPSGDPLGRPIKENLMVPPRAGGRSAREGKASGEPPVLVNVKGRSRILIAHYGFDEKDVQYVNLDGKRTTLRQNGPNGLGTAYFQKYVKSLGDDVYGQVKSERDLLLVPEAPLGALVGSFDNFRSGFLVADGVEISVPRRASHLALGINGALGFFGAHEGTGFRVKITEREKAQVKRDRAKRLAAAANKRLSKLDILPISDVMPAVCVEGYEDIQQKREIGKKVHSLYRYIGNVCWGVINVYGRDRPREPEPGDK